MRLRMAIGAVIGLAVTFLLMNLYQKAVRYLDEEETGSIPACCRMADAGMQSSQMTRWNLS